MEKHEFYVIIEVVFVQQAFIYIGEFISLK